MISLLACRAFLRGTLGERVRLLSMEALGMSLKSINTILPHATAKCILQNLCFLFSLCHV